MKTLFTISILILLLTIPCFAQVSVDGQITKAEVKPDVVKWVLTSIDIIYPQNYLRVVLSKVDSTGTSVGDDVTVKFINAVDDLETPEDESTTEFTDLMANINKGNIEKVITDAVKIKLGI